LRFSAPLIYSVQAPRARKEAQLERFDLIVEGLGHFVGQNLLEFIKSGSL